MLREKEPLINHNLLPGLLKQHSNFQIAVVQRMYQDQEDFLYRLVKDKPCITREFGSFRPIPNGLLYHWLNLDKSLDNLKSGVDAFGRTIPADVQREMRMNELIDECKQREQVRDLERTSSEYSSCTDSNDDSISGGVGFGLGYSGGLGSSPAILKTHHCNDMYIYKLHEIDQLIVNNRSLESQYTEIIADIDPILLDTQHLSLILMKFQSHDKWKSIYEQAYIAESWKLLMQPLQILKGCKLLIDYNNPDISTKRLTDGFNYSNGLDTPRRIEVRI